MEKIIAKKIIYPTKSDQWFGTTYNMNIYKGCSHGCIYCDSRSACYKIENFEQIKVKENALTIMKNDLRRLKKKGLVGMGSMSDPYNPLEKDLELTRGALSILHSYQFGVSIDTKSTLITRDIDLLKEMQKQVPVICKMSITSIDDQLSKKIEPYAAISRKRLDVCEVLASAGIFTGILMNPLLPFINDNQKNIKNMVKAAAHTGCTFIYPGFGLTLRDRQRAYFYTQLDLIFPGLKESYIKHYGNDYICHSPKWNTLYAVFIKACETYGLLYDMKSITSALQKNYKPRQLVLFDI